MKEEFTNKIVNIYAAYLNIISPYIIQLEVLDGEFPVEILNEIRSIFTHLARCYNSDSDAVISENIEKAERHVKRAVLDCFKYMCVTYDDKYREFERLYSSVDLSYVDNGKFLSELGKRRKEAIRLKNLAQKNELVAEDVNDVFKDYENAYNSYASIYNLIEDSIEHIDFLKHKSNTKNILNIIFGISGIIGLFLTVLFRFI